MRGLEDSSRAARTLRRALFRTSSADLNASAAASSRTLRSMFTALLLAWPCLLAAQPMALEDILASSRDRLGPVIDNPEQHRLQIMVTYIELGEDGVPKLHRDHYRSDPNEYFYPASVVKFPIAVAALEWIEDTGNRSIDQHTTMLTEASRPSQTEVLEDPTAADGRPTIAHYIRKLSIVSDNDASNRLFELIGQDELQRRMQRWGMTASRITHRLAIRLPAKENRHSNAVRFVDADGTLLHRRPAREGGNLAAGIEPILLGVGEVVDNEYVDNPKDFSGLNHMPLAEVHQLLEAIIVPEGAAAERIPRMSESGRKLLLEAMRVMPSESGIDAYQDAERYPDGFANYFIMGRNPDRLPEGVTIINKVGRAYGFLTETAYIEDATGDVAFILSATLEVNANGVYNDNEYEYAELGFPFLAELGMLVLEQARMRSRR